ncbi:hypothetical protein CDIK_3576 [Cucumispora dikerogammari]|nr:hypothetical protein CDIK_3576 [Cucumispora dikerogammari]
MVEGGDSVVIFGTKSNIIHLTFNKTWLMVGTFSVVPPQFSHLCTIQCEIRNTFVPLIFCLMPSKTIDMYNIFLSILRYELNVTGPDTLITDFEIAPYISFNQTFPNTTIFTCLFHFSQIIWRKIQSLGFSKLFKSNTLFNFHVRLIMALAFVPEKEISLLSSKLFPFFERENGCKEIFLLYEWFHTKFIDTNRTTINHNPEVGQFTIEF